MISEDSLYASWKGDVQCMSHVLLHVIYVNLAATQGINHLFNSIDLFKTRKKQWKNGNLWCGFNKYEIETSWIKCKNICKKQTLYLTK